MRSLLLLALLALPAAAGDLSDVPGRVIGYEPSPNPLANLFRRGKFIGSPTLAILPSGHYVAAHDLFAHGGGETEDGLGITKVYRSTDRGVSWSRVSVVRGAFWSTLFVHDGALYLLGSWKQGGHVVIRRSTDEGRTWTTPRDAATGLLSTTPNGGSPNPPAVHDGRLWIGLGTKAWSAPLGSDLLDAGSWARTRGVATSASWLGGKFTLWSEGGVVASPGTGVVLLPKVKDLPRTALLRMTAPGGLPDFDPARDFVSLPGAEKKFGVGYDPVSRLFYALTNPVLPQYQDEIDEGWSIWRPFTRPLTPATVRNAAAIYTSPDLRTWTQRRVFLHSKDVHHVGFQYLNFLVDGDDLVVVSRTAFNVGTWKTPRSHDSNLLTFHRVRDFRPAPPAPTRTAASVVWWRP